MIKLGIFLPFVQKIEPNLFLTFLILTYQAKNIKNNRLKLAKTGFFQPVYIVFLSLFFNSII
jgi:hypothetical protein